MLVPERPGVYLLHDLRGILYAGRTRNLSLRFHQHYWLTKNELLAVAMQRPFGELTFSWILVDGENERADLERRVIAWLKPPCNRLIPNDPLNEGE
jgi:excinuclease UvrABC nuclease subunit